MLCRIQIGERESILGGLYLFLSSSFSSIFDEIDRRLIGLYDATSVGFFPGFWIMMIFACFKGAGQYCSLCIALKMYRSVCYLSWGISCTFGLR